MPVKKTKRRAAKATAAVAEEKKILSRWSRSDDAWARKIMMTLVVILLVYVIVWVGTVIRNNIKAYMHIGFADRAERTLTVSADAKVTAAPDIAMTTIGMVATGESVEEAQQINTTVINELIARLQALGIADADIQTANYNIYPQYNYTETEGRVLQGYEVNQSVTVKIRNLDNANSVLALAGQVGANSVSGLEFIIDDREIYRTQAREIALEKAGEKAKVLAHTLGVGLVSVVSYEEYEGGSDFVPRYAVESSVGLGGGIPDIQSGSTDVVMNVNVTYEIR